MVFIATLLPLVVRDDMHRTVGRHMSGSISDLWSGAGPSAASRPPLSVSWDTSRAESVGHTHIAAAVRGFGPHEFLRDGALLGSRICGGPDSQGSVVRWRAVTVVFVRGAPGTGLVTLRQPADPEQRLVNLGDPRQSWRPLPLPSSAA